MPSFSTHSTHLEATLYTHFRALHTHLTQSEHHTRATETLTTFAATLETDARETDRILLQPDYLATAPIKDWRALTKKRKKLVEESRALTQSERLCAAAAAASEMCLELAWAGCEVEAWNWEGLACELWEVADAAREEDARERRARLEEMLACFPIELEGSEATRRASGS